MDGSVINAIYKTTISISNATIDKNNGRQRSGILLFLGGTRVFVSNTIIQNNSICAITCNGCFIDITKSQIIKNVALGSGGFILW